MTRFEDHVDAMRLHEDDVRRRMQMPRADDLDDIADRADKLRAEFGSYAQKDWWGCDRDGRTVGMPQLIRRLADAPQFRPRLKGEAPVLEQYYALQHKAWTQALHHTAAGMQACESGDGALPVAIAQPSAFLILFGNYWVFGQLIFVTLDLGGPVEALEYFEKLFLAGLAVFTETIGVSASWADQVPVWAAEGQDPSDG